MLQLFQAGSVGTVQSSSSFTGRPAICLSAPTVRDVYRKRAIWLSPGSLHLSARFILVLFLFLFLSFFPDIFFLYVTTESSQTV